MECHTTAHGVPTVLQYGVVGTGCSSIHKLCCAHAALRHKNTSQSLFIRGLLHHNIMWANKFVLLEDKAQSNARRHNTKRFRYWFLDTGQPSVTQGNCHGLKTVLSFAVPIKADDKHKKFYLSITTNLALRLADRFLLRTHITITLIFILLCYITVFFRNHEYT